MGLPNMTSDRCVSMSENLFSNVDDQTKPAPPSPPVDEKPLSRAERKKQRELAAAPRTVPVTDALTRRRGDRDLLDGSRDYRLVPVADLEEDAENPRTVYKELQDLGESMKEIGTREPVTCWVDKDGHLHLKDGHRRLRAAKAAGLTHLPALIEYRQGPKLVEQLTANIHQVRMNAVDEALAIKRLMREEKLATQQQVAARLHRSLGWVNLRMQLLELAEDELAAVREDRVAYTEALKRRKQGRDVITGEVVASGPAVSAGSAGRGPERFSRTVQDRQAGGASVHRVRSSSGSEADEREVVAKPRSPGAFFSDEHPLSFRVSHRCGNHGRPAPQIGGVGCGECWEYIIRTDERIAVKSEMRGVNGGMRRPE